MNKEIEDALHTLLHCSLKDTEYETQVEQYKLVRDYITNLKKENKQLKENNMSMQEEMVRTWEKLDDLQQIEQEHQKINGELREENQKYKEAIDKAINNSQYWIDYYTRLNSDERIALRLQENIDILKEIKNENKDTRI